DLVFRRPERRSPRPARRGSLTGRALGNRPGMITATTRLGVALVVAVAACSNTNHAATEPPTTAVAPRSLTPRVTTAAAPLSTALWTPADLRAPPGAPADLRAVPANSAKLFADPDPRGPCGQRLA